VTKKIRLGLIGLGQIAKVHILGVRNAFICHDNLPVDVQYTSLLTTHPEENAEIARRLGIESIHTDLDRFLDESEIDGVDIATPHWQHFEQSKAALVRDIAVYCEKPLSMNGEEARELARLVKAHPVPNRVAFTSMFNPGVLRAKAYLESGIIGDVITVRAHTFHSRYLDRDLPTSWRLQNKLSGGGALADLGVHTLNSLMFLVGDVKQLRANARTFVDSRPVKKGSPERMPVDVDDWALVELEFACGASGSVEASRISSGRDGNLIEIFGTKGSITLEGDDWPRVHVFAQSTSYKGLHVEIEPVKKEIMSLYPPSRVSVGGMAGGQMASILRFGLSIARNEVTYPGAPDFAAGVRSMVVLEAAYESSKRGGANMEIYPGEDGLMYFR